MGIDSAGIQKSPWAVRTSSCVKSGACATKGRTLQFGRSGKCASVICDDPRVSRLHCSVTIQKDGSAVLQNFSKNGTFVDGILVRTRRRVRCTFSLLADSFRFALGDEILIQKKKSRSQDSTQYEDRRILVRRSELVVLTWNIGNEKQYEKSSHLQTIADVVNGAYSDNPDALFVAALQEVNVCLKGLMHKNLRWIDGPLSSPKRNVLIVGRADAIRDEGYAEHGGSYAPLVYAKMLYKGTLLMAASGHVDCANTRLRTQAVEGVRSWLRSAGKENDVAFVAGDFNQDLNRIKGVLRPMWPSSTGFDTKGWPFGTYHGYLNKLRNHVTENRIIDGVLTLQHAAVEPISAELVKVPDFGRDEIRISNKRHHDLLHDTVFRPHAPADHFPTLTKAFLLGNDFQTPVEERLRSETNTVIKTTL